MSGLEEGTVWLTMCMINQSYRRSEMQWRAPNPILAGLVLGDPIALVPSVTFQGQSGPCSASDPNLCCPACSCETLGKWLMFSELWFCLCKTGWEVAPTCRDGCVHWVREDGEDVCNSGAHSRRSLKIGCHGTVPEQSVRASFGFHRYRGSYFNLFIFIYLFF